MDKKNRTILVWRSAALGDFILSAPAFYELKKNYPNDRIILLTITAANKKQREKVAQSYMSSTDNSYPWVQLAVPHLINEVVVIKSLSSVSYLYSVARYLRQYDIRFSVLMLDPCAPWLGRIKKLFLMQFLSPFAKIVGWRGKGSLSGNRQKLKEQGLLKHHVHGSLQFIHELKLSYPTDNEIKFDLRLERKDEIWASTWLNSHQMFDSDYIILGPGAIHRHKMWPLENYCELVNDLHERFSVPIVILGTKNDFENGEVIQANANNATVYNLCGLTSIGQSAALMKKCKLFIGNDGGAVHLADAMGAKVISIVPGIEYPDSIEPWHNKHNSIRKFVECAPCYRFDKCYNFGICMSLIKVNDILLIVEKELG
jgi:ADP-heptose:LPS heptosyltransferase